MKMTKKNHFNALLKKTEQKIKFLQDKREDLIKCMEQQISKDCYKYCLEEKHKAEENLIYYMDIVEVLEGVMGYYGGKEQE